MIGGLFLPMTLAALALARPAYADVVDHATQDAARTLGLAGLELFDKGELLGALAKFEQAYSLYRAPTLGLLSARCLAKLGRLKAASDRYRDVLSIDLGESPSEQFIEAKKTAEQESAALTERIPKVTIVIEGVPPEEAEVSLDGVPIPPYALVTPQPVDPGTHKIRAKKGDTSKEVEVTAAEGATARAVVKLDVKPAVTAPPDEGSGGFFSPASRRTAAFVGIGIGGASLVTGAVLTGLLASTKSDLDKGDLCVDGRCAPAAKDDVKLYNGLRVGSTATFIAGAVFAGAGVALLLTTPRPPAAAASARKGAGVQAELSIGVSSIMLKGAF